MTTGLSASGARIRGDDYQHLFAWLQAIYASNEASDIIKIGIEDPEAGNADDVTVYRRDGSCEFYQTKSSADGNRTVGMDLLMKSSKSGGLSMIQKFHNLWVEKRDKCRLKIILVINMLPETNDRLLSMRDGRDSTVARILQNAKPESKEGLVRRELAEHLRVDDSKVLEFCHDLEFNLGHTYGDWMHQAKVHMLVGGLRHDEDAVAQGVGIVRAWVTKGKRIIDAREIRQALGPLMQSDDSPTASILVEAIDRDPISDMATIVLNWTSSFPGSEPRVRHQVSDPTLWNYRFRPELQHAARDLRSQGHTHILVQGYMRLPTWFVTGAELGKTAGFRVSSFQGKSVWSSVGEWHDVPIRHVHEMVGVGRDLAVGIALAVDPSADVLAYIHDKQIGVEKYVCIMPVSGADNQAIGGGAEARGWAYAVRDTVRGLVREYKPDIIHLFLAGPHGAILLLGHLWDRMPSTQLYEDLGSTAGYAPSYVIPGN